MSNPGPLLSGFLKIQPNYRVQQSWFTVCLLSGLCIFAIVSTISSPSEWRSLSLIANLFVSRILWFPCRALDSDMRVLGAETFDDLSSFGRTSQVQFDNYSLILRGQRIFLHSGEFHTFRLPVPSLWPDILEKVKAAGLNAISVYTHMGLINPSRGVIDLDGCRALQPLYDAARETGIWIVLRPGPYINAETSAGGVAHWATTEVAGNIRTNTSDWKAAWRDYIQAIIKTTILNQITAGGPVLAIQIDNEYNQNDYGHGGYFAELEDAYCNSGIVVPLTYNDQGPVKNFINGTGAVDLYGMDSYPQGFDCSNPTVWNPVITDYHTYHARVNPAQPWYIPEFRGSYDAWGPAAPGYEQCRKLTGSDFQSVFNLQLWASNAKLINYYMFYGGTSWGAIPHPGVYTSYDYGSAITESRQLTSKFDELKRQSMFLRSSPDFYRTDWIGDTSTGATSANCSAVFVTLLRNPDTMASFYVVRQIDSTSTAITNFKLNVTTTSSGNQLQLPLVAPSITLTGRQSKLVVGNYAFGSSSKLLYSTAQIFFAGTIDGRDILFIYGDATQAHEAALVLSGTPNKQIQSTTHVTITSSTRFTNNASIINVLPGTEGLVTVWDSDLQLVLFGDTLTAGTFWVPVIGRSEERENPFKNYWGIGTNDSILIGGPYLVRSASISDSGSSLQLALRGDLKTDTRLIVIGPKSVRSVTWNGQRVDGDVAAAGYVTAFGGFVGELRMRGLSSCSKSDERGQEEVLKGGIEIPKLGGWNYRDSLPEVFDGFDDAEWVLANKTETYSPGMHYGDGRVLYGCDYGFCENIVLWRGHFNATGAEKSVNLSINGGEGFAASVWLNDVFLHTSFGNSSNNRNIIEETDEVFVFPPGAIRQGADNVLTIVQDNMGRDEGDRLKSPRGVRGFKLDAGNFTQWKVQGKVGGYTHYPDKVRGIFNEGGLFGERQGWHLPGYPTNNSLWVSRDLAAGLPNSRNGGVGIGFFITTFELGFPKGFDIMLSFTFDEGLGQAYRAVLFVNGWMMGKRVGNLGPQAKFPVHEGILDYNGLNTVAVALWVMEPNRVISPRLELTLDAVYDGGVGKVITNNPGWSPVGRRRSCEKYNE